MATVNVRGYGGFERQAKRVHKLNHHHTPGWVHLMSHQPYLNQRVRLGPDGFKITAGFGGWNTTTRPRAVGMTTWTGVPPYEAKLQIIYNDWDGVENLIRQLMDVARGSVSSGPGIVWLDGIPALPVDRWIISDLEFDDDHMIRKTDMRRRRQIVTITLLEYQPPVYELLAKNALKKARPKTVIYKVKKGDTPAKIARARHCHWQDLKTLNKKGTVRAANQHLKVGIQIMVPVKAPPAKHHKPRRGK